MLLRTSTCIHTLANFKHFAGSPAMEIRQCRKCVVYPLLLLLAAAVAHLKGNSS